MTMTFSNGPGMMTSPRFVHKECGGLLLIYAHESGRWYECQLCGWKSDISPVVWRTIEVG